MDGLELAAALARNEKAGGRVVREAVVDADAAKVKFENSSLQRFQINEPYNWD